MFTSLSDMFRRGTEGREARRPRRSRAQLRESRMSPDAWARSDVFRAIFEANLRLRGIAVASVPPRRRAA